MVRNIVVLGGSSHPTLNDTICETLGIQQGKALFSKFAVGETRVEIEESVRGKDVYIIQSGGGKTNDHLVELLIAISACKTASASKVTAVLPLFPYSRQSDIPYNKSGAPLVKASNTLSRANTNEEGAPSYTFESTPTTPHPDRHESRGLSNGVHHLNRAMSKVSMDELADGPSMHQARFNNYKRDGDSPVDKDYFNRSRAASTTSSAAVNNAAVNGISGHDYAPKECTTQLSSTESFKPKPGYRQWVAQAGTLVADLLTCAGADHVITMDLHDPQYQGFFDIPVDNLYGRPLLKKYIQQNIPDYRKCIVVSPDAGGAKRATAIADSLGMEFALIHKERRPTKITDRQNATMMLVGDVDGKICILIDDLADTCNTITRAAKLLKNEGAAKIYALVTHGVLSGDAIDRINHSALDKVVVTNTIDQRDHQRRCPKLEVLEVGTVFAEAIRRVHYGESISVLFQYD
ncbi:ribose-phosphate pyrophosphokinase [Lithohypha guttulata]|uniref:ribose-phosphate pyrophosphokinase n=1 Tax=Lithohypha guttulata TaxID=1690604 RepID=UPI002DE0DD06|nr:ribose-phosphate pyrophosphokinase [Lithohypha guttulata]KAK5106716.1 ribose-phosphate pyrophosphokinase [Lithohypha guttulata]